MNKDKKGNISYQFRIFTRICALLITAFIAELMITDAISQTTVTVKSFGEGITAKKFYSSTIDEDNTVWFLTEAGIVSFDGMKWVLHNTNPNVASAGLKDIASDITSNGKELWLASPAGVTVAAIPVDTKSGATTFNPENSRILSNNVHAIAIGKKELRWFGTDKGISALNKGKWLTNSYDDRYPESIFQGFPITSMATSPDGDSLYIGSQGGGVMRVFRNDVDAVSGASEYVGWGPILMPSDSVYSIHISSDGTQWIGTNRGVAKHTGYKTLEGWIVFTTSDGLADDLVQAISSDKKGNIYFGTKDGLSVFDGVKWSSYKIKDGLASNNILTISADKQDRIWIGTDNGVTAFIDGKFTNYR
jgi:ligand-binding sensor domain-containing protein